MASISYVSHPAHVHMFKRSFLLLDSGVLKSQDPDWRKFKSNLITRTVERKSQNSEVTDESASKLRDYGTNTNKHTDLSAEMVNIITLCIYLPFQSPLMPSTLAMVL